MVEEIAGLLQHPDVPSPEPRPLGFGAARHSATGHLDAPSIGLVEAGDAGKERRFAAAGGTDEGHHFRRAHGQARAAQRPHLRVADVKEAVEVHRRDGRRHRHWKLFDIRSHWSTLSAPLGAENVTDATFPPLANR